jgi:hypothetical protein
MVLVEVLGLDSGDQLVGCWDHFIQRHAFGIVFCHGCHDMGVSDMDGFDFNFM